MFTVIDKEVYSTLELLLSQMFGENFEVLFANYLVPDEDNQDFENATQFHFSVVFKDL